jgi:His-Xaa-Ser system protein HxsD
MLVTYSEPSYLQLQIDSRIYSIDVLHKCFYWHGGRYAVDITNSHEAYIVTISGIENSESKEALITKIKRDLIDFKTRNIISAETRNIREILIAKAFANDDSFDEDPPGHVNDPLGFDPTNI